MGIVTVDTSNPEDLLKPPEFVPLSEGKHLLEVANDLKTESAKEGPNLVVKVELRCQDEGEDKGRVVFDNFVIMQVVETDKQRKAKEIHEKRLTQFAIACGVKTESDFRNGNGDIPLDDFKGKVCQAMTGIETSKWQGRTRQNAYIKRYLFEPEQPSEA